MNATATLFDTGDAEYAATVEVLGVIFSAEDDGYAVLEVQDAESGEGFALVGPVAHHSVPTDPHQPRRTTCRSDRPAACWNVSNE